MCVLAGFQSKATRFANVTDEDNGEGGFQPQWSSHRLGECMSHHIGDKGRGYGECKGDWH